jgi:hypothetical protein
MEITRHIYENPWPGTPRWNLELVINEKPWSIDHILGTIIGRTWWCSPMTFKNAIMSTIEIFIMMRHVMVASNEIETMRSKHPRPHGHVNVL